MTKVASAVGEFTARAWRRIWMIARNSPQRIDRGLKQTAGDGNDLIYRFFQLWAVILSAAIALGIVALLWVSSWLWFSTPSLALLAGIALLIVGGRTIEQMKNKGGAIAAVGLLMVLIGLPLAALRIFGSPSNQLQAGDFPQLSEQVGEQFSAADRPSSTAEGQQRTAGTAGKDPSGFGGNQPKNFELVNTRGMVFRVYIPPGFAHDLAVYKDACREISAGRDFTSIEFWIDRSKIPTADEPIMSDEQFDAEVAMYLKNVSKGVNSFEWLRKGEGTDVGPVD